MQEQAIESTKRVHLALILLFFAYVYAAQIGMHDNETLRSLTAVDALLVLRNVSLEPKDNWRSFRGTSPIFRIQIQACEVMRQSWLIQQLGPTSAMRRLGARSAIERNKRYHPERIIGAYFLGPYQTHFGSTYECPVDLMSGPPDRDYNVIPSPQYPIVGGTVRGSDIHLVNFGVECGDHLFGASALMIKVDGEWVLGVPHRVSQFVPTLTQPLLPGFPPARLSLQRDFLDRYPIWLKTSASLESEYDLYPLRSAEAAILTFAAGYLGTFPTLGEFDTTIPKLFALKETGTSLLGVSVGLRYFLNAAPLVVLALAYTMWRRLRLIDHKSGYIPNLWFLTDVSDWAGKLFAAVWASSPFAITLVTYALFALSSGTGLVVFGRVLTVGGRLGVDVPERPFPPEYDYWATSLIFVFAVNMLISIMVTLHMARIVLGDRRMRSARRFWRVAAKRRAMR